MKKPKILVVGSFVMDQIATTSVFPREGQTVLGGEFSKAPGGKGANQAVQVARLGADTTLFGKLGQDSNAEDMLATCREAGIDVSHVVRDPTTPSGCSVIILEQKPGEDTKNRIIVLSGTNLKITKEDVAFLKDTIDQYDMVMLQLEIPMEINELVAKYAHDKGVPVMLNPAPSAPLSDELLSHLTFISPNEHEAADLTGIKIEHHGSDFNKEQAKAAAEALRNKGVKNVLITMGTAGAVLINDEGTFFSPTINSIKAVDPTAAGDSFVATFCTGICCKWTIQETLDFANCVATLTVSEKGAMPSLPTLEKVKAFNKEHSFNTPDVSMLQ
ncbi:MAG: ribokinase [Treponema sp.]|nr:ribokinase [Treponema sp.]